MISYSPVRGIFFCTNIDNHKNLKDIQQTETWKFIRLLIFGLNFIHYSVSFGDVKRQSNFDYFSVRQNLPSRLSSLLKASKSIQELLCHIWIHYTLCIFYDNIIQRNILLNILIFPILIERKFLCCRIFLDVCLRVTLL